MNLAIILGFDLMSCFDTTNKKDDNNEVTKLFSLKLIFDLVILLVGWFYLLGYTFNCDLIYSWFFFLVVITVWDMDVNSWLWK